MPRLVLCSRVRSIVIPTAPAATATVAKLRRTIRAARGGVKPQMGLENCERILEVGEQIFQILDSNRNPYEAVG